MSLVQVPQGAQRGRLLYTDGRGNTSWYPQAGGGVLVDSVGTLGAGVDAEIMQRAVDSNPGLGGPIYLTDREYVVEKTVTLKKYAAVIGAGHGAIDNDEAGKYPYLEDFKAPTTINSRSYLQMDKAVFQMVPNAVAPRFENLFLKGPRPQNSVDSWGIGNCAINGNYPSQMRIQNVAITGYTVGMNLIGPQGLRADGLYIKYPRKRGMTLDGATDCTFTNFYFSDVYHGSDYEAANVCLVGAGTADIFFQGGFFDEGGTSGQTNGSCVWIMEGKRIHFVNFFIHSNQGGYGVRIDKAGRGTSPSNIFFSSGEIEPFASTSVRTLWNVDGTKLDLTDVRTSLAPGGAGAHGIVDAAIDTVYTRVNGQSSIKSKATVPVAADFDGLPAAYPSGPIFADADGRIYTRLATGEVVSDGRRSMAFLSADVTNANATANTMQDVTGLSFPVVAGKRYWFRIRIDYTAAATTTGSRWSINGPASPTRLHYRSMYSLTTTTFTNNWHVTSYDFPAASNATSATTTANLVEIDGWITPSANGTVVVRFASEVASSAITAKAGSFIDYGLV